MVLARRGYRSVMKLMIGFSAGVVTGMYLSSKMTERQRNQLAARTSAAVRHTTESVKESSIGESLASNVAKVTSAAGERVADAVDDAGRRVASAVESTGAAATHVPRDQHTAVTA